jgi:hypothetical protein
MTLLLPHETHLLHLNFFPAQSRPRSPGAEIVEGMAHHPSTYRSILKAFVTAATSAAGPFSLQNVKRE